MGPLKMLKWLCSSEENYIGQSAVRFDLWGSTGASWKEEARRWHD